MAHSLGNMVVSSMIQDHGLSVSKYLMCNSAVPAEAYDASLSLRVPQLVHPEWEDYPTNTWTASYHSLFDELPTDDRRLLEGMGESSANYCWQKQEVMKGSVLPAGTMYGGWGSTSGRAG